jgi:hypothetical protein
MSAYPRISFSRYSQRVSAGPFNKTLRTPAARQATTISAVARSRTSVRMACCIWGGIGGSEGRHGGRVVAEISGSCSEGAAI